MILFPEGTLRRKYFEAVDRWFSDLIFSSPLTMSTYCGKIIFAFRTASGPKPCYVCRFICWFCNLIEYDHCIRNKDRP